MVPCGVNTGLGVSGTSESKTLLFTDPSSLVATFSAFIQNFTGLIAIRLLLGLFEAGLFPGLVVYLTIFYNKRHIALRMAYLFATAAIAGAVGGLVSFGIGMMDNDPNDANTNPGDPGYVEPPGTAGWRAWRWIFAVCHFQWIGDTSTSLTPSDQRCTDSRHCACCTFRSR